MSKLLFKPGFEYDTHAPAGYAILLALRAIAEFFPKNITITAGTNGQHAKNSRHYKGTAFDVRAKDQTPDEQQLFMAQLDVSLGPQQFYYALEDKGTANEHWHIQVRSTVTYTIKDLLA